jgi:hypothetical protein
VKVRPEPSGARESPLGYSSCVTLGFSLASLAIYSSTHPAAPLSALLGLTPAKMHEAGDENRSRKTGRLYGHYRHSAWIYDPAGPPAAPDDDGFSGLRNLLVELGDLDRLGAALATLRPQYRTVIRWSGTVSSQGNFEIEASLIAALARLGCDLYGTAHYEDGDDTDSLQA